MEGEHSARLRARARTKSISDLEEPAQSSIVQLSTYYVYVVAVLAGLFYDFTDAVMNRKKRQKEAGYAPLVKGIDSFYSRRLASRLWHCLNNVVCSSPGAVIEVVERERDANGQVHLTDRKRTCLNLGSYNYLGFADDWKSTCRDRVMDTLDEYGVSSMANATEGGYLAVHVELEEYLAKFLRKEACMVFNMGYGTNASAIPALFGKGTLLVSDTLNHCSIVNGSRASGAVVRVFKHNDVSHLDSVLREAIVGGQPVTNRPWKKIVVLVEGIYSMEGECCDLADIVRVAKKYKAFMYVDEAHSIGALGRTGRGILEHSKVDPDDIDILMGTFTKSFGAMGGYIAASADFIKYLRTHSCSNFTSCSMSPVVTQQIITSLRIISGDDGTDIGRQKLQDIRDNSNFFRTSLAKMGCQVLGDEDSPVIPMMLYVPTKIIMFHQLCMERGLAVVTVGFPAVPLNGSRTRFCISAAHTRAQLEDALAKIEEVVDILRLRYNIENW
mmetsp:Transcript_19070/g.35297  ORF Transcript_19070/g.35297 Transcript_19070/m.35297 type:complete len:499 (-) Transcript_19070:119-1615(-)